MRHWTEDDVTPTMVINVGLSCPVALVTPDAFVDLHQRRWQVFRSWTVLSGRDSIIIELIDPTGGKHE